MSLGSELAAKFASGDGRVGVIGLGYVGLPLCVEFAKKLSVLGFDIDDRKVDLLSRGESYIGHISNSEVAAAAKSGRFEATTDFSRLAGVDAILICVPTPLGRSREPDLSYVERTAESIVEHLRKGQLVEFFGKLHLRQGRFSVSRWQV